MFRKTQSNRAFIKDKMQVMVLNFFYVNSSLFSNSFHFIIVLNCICGSFALQKGVIETPDYQ